MRTQKRSNFLASVIILVTMLLPQRASTSAPCVRASSIIPFTEHTIDGSFYRAKSVFATDVDGDGDVDILGAAFSADDITWWENDGSENFTGVSPFIFQE